MVADNIMRLRESAFALLLTFADAKVKSLHSLVKALYHDTVERQNATQAGQRIATEVRKRLQPQIAGGATPHLSLVERHHFTVVGGSAMAQNISSITILSVRPDGAQQSLLSIICVAHDSVGKMFIRGIKGFNNIALRVEGQELECVMVGSRLGYEHAFARIICSADGWNARRAMQHRRWEMLLRLSSQLLAPTSGWLEIPFTTEAIDRLLAPARVSICLDIQYYDFFPKRDFDEWAFAHKLMGVDRVYVPDQLAYRAHVVTQAARGFVVPSHDLPHRYVNMTNGTSDRLTVQHRTTYYDKEQLDAVANYLCLHEHWYDDWIGVAWTPDEYLTFEGLGLSPPSVRTSMVGEAINHYVRMRRSTESNEWRFCEPELCMNRPFYSPAAQLSSESSVWTLPGDGMKIRFGADGQLAVERYVQRHALLSRSSSNRKCFVHSDWRMGGQVKLHGFPMTSCPHPLNTKGWCLTRAFPVLRRPCLELCGYFGNETCNECVAPPAPGCGGSPLEYLVTDGPTMEGIELAHFRVPPRENRKGGPMRPTSWLSNMSGTLRRLVDGANQGTPSLDPYRSVADAFIAESERLAHATAASHVPPTAVASARREARDHAISLGHLVINREGDEPAPRCLEGLQAAVRVLQHHLAHAVWDYQVQDRR